jgi:hypothetical protein
VLATLADRGLLDPMTVVVHGDHGSRIRRRDAPNIDPSLERVTHRWDYTGPPGVRDLLDRFSTLLAIKLPKQRDYTRVERKGSVLRFLLEEVYREEPSGLGPVDSVFLFDERGTAKEVQLDKLWRQ